MTTFTNTGSWRMTSAFYNEMRKMEVEDVRDDDTLRLVSLVPMAASAAAQTTSTTAAKPAPTMDFDNDEGSLEDVAGLVLSAG